MIVIAIDVGLQGGLAIARYDAGSPDSGELLHARHMPVRPTLRRGELAVLPCVRTIGEYIREHGATHAVVEAQSVRPKQGIASSGLLMRQFGQCEATTLTLGLPTQLVAPPVWKRAMGLIRGDKEASRQRAIALFPHIRHLMGRKQDHGPAEAALIAWWKVSHAAANDEPEVLV